MSQREILELGIDELRPGRYQPRNHVSEESLAELAESMREQGVLQPLIVRVIAAPPAATTPPLDGLPAPSDATFAPAGGASASGAGAPLYEIVAGERRWRAARLVGLTTVPVIVRELTDQSALAVALIENLQREDLNPIDKARSMRRLVDEFDLTHEEIAKALGRSRTSVTNFLRLLDLADDVKDAMVTGKLDMGHARALLPLAPDQQVAVARKIGRLGWSVRQVERTVQTLLAEPEGSAAPSVADLQTRWLQNQLAREIGEKISIKPDGKGEYVLKIEFASLGKLEGTLQQLQDLIRKIRETAGPRARERS